MQSSSTDGGIGSGGEATCPASEVTHLTLMTPVTAFQVLDIGGHTGLCFRGFLTFSVAERSHSGPSFVGLFFSCYMCDITHVDDVNLQFLDLIGLFLYIFIY